MLALFAVDDQMAWNVLNVDSTGNFSLSSINDKMMLNVENVDENNKDLQIRFIARFFDNILNSSVWIKIYDYNGFTGCGNVSHMIYNSKSILMSSGI